MCGRFTLRAAASAVAEQFGLFEIPPLPPRFNIAPRQPVAVVRLPADRPAGQRQWAVLRWGLIPSWAKDPSIGNRLINARAETVAEKPAFRTALRRRRCLVVADGFYEWRNHRGKKRPCFFRFRDDRPFGFAGLWESWEGPDHSLLESCTILTTEANELVAPVHDRMPVIIPADQYPPWLDPAQQRPEQLLPLLRPYPAAEMEVIAVRPLVNNPAHDSAQCIVPVDEPPDLWNARLGSQ